ncbi:MAG TPA: hypothetical protein VL137_09645 [Polyangiaceae bacterium]|nr:hypothetical protein [Polyangiaceae bacterium]
MKKSLFRALPYLVIFGLPVAFSCSTKSDSPTGGNTGASGSTATGGAGGDALGGTSSLGGMTGSVAGGGGDMTAGGGGATGGAAGAMAGGAGGATGGAGGATGGTGGVADGPATLFDTGLYADAAMTQLAAGVMEYTPQFVLWSDGADKKRYMLLPPGTMIDTTDMDHWKYPVGTKVWKEFTSQNKRIETRLLWKKDDTTWFMGSYAWSEDLTMATLVPKKGQMDALGTTHDIPSTHDCGNCHQGQKDKVLGFTAIQLSHDGSVTNLKTLKMANLLSAPPTEDAFVVPGTAQEKAVLGLFHANCGTCHNPDGAGYDRNPTMRMLLLVGQLGSVQQTDAYATTVGVANFQDLTTLNGFAGITQRIEPGHPEQSAVYLRMHQRDPEQLISMPPIGTEEVDTTGSQLISDWITALPPVADAG